MLILGLSQKKRDYFITDGCVPDDHLSWFSFNAKVKRCRWCQFVIKTVSWRWFFFWDPNWNFVPSEHAFFSIPLSKTQKNLWVINGQYSPISWSNFNIECRAEHRCWEIDGRNIVSKWVLWSITTLLQGEYFAKILYIVSAFIHWVVAQRDRWISLEAPGNNH